jgi:hypothetical protein
MLPLVGLGLWHALSPARLRLELRGAGLEERWAKAQKKARPFPLQFSMSAPVF